MPSCIFPPFQRPGVPASSPSRGRTRPPHPRPARRIGTNAQWIHPRHRRSGTSRRFTTDERVRDQSGRWVPGSGVRSACTCMRTVVRPEPTKAPVNVQAGVSGVVARAPDVSDEQFAQGGGRRIVFPYLHEVVSNVTSRGLFRAVWNRRASATRAAIVFFPNRVMWS